MWLGVRLHVHYLWQQLPPMLPASISPANLALSTSQQRRASHPALAPRDYEALFDDHLRSLDDAVVAACKEALAPLLAPLLPPDVAAAGKAARAVAKSGAVAAVLAGAAPQASGGGPLGAVQWPAVDARLLAPPLTSYGALLAAPHAVRALEADAAGWGRASPEARERAWREWTDEHVWGRPPVKPPPVVLFGRSERDGDAMAAGVPRLGGGGGGGGVYEERGGGRGSRRSRSRSRSRSRGRYERRQRSRSRSRSRSRGRGDRSRRQRSRSRSRSRGGGERSSRGRERSRSGERSRRRDDRSSSRGRRRRSSSRER